MEVELRLERRAGPHPYNRAVSGKVGAGGARAAQASSSPALAPVTSSETVLTRGADKLSGPQQPFQGVLCIPCYPGDRPLLPPGGGLRRPVRSVRCAVDALEEFMLSNEDRILRATASRSRMMALFECQRAGCADCSGCDVGESADKSTALALITAPVEEEDGAGPCRRGRRGGRGQ